MLERLKCLPGLLLLLLVACSTHVAGTTDENNALAENDSSSSVSSSSGILNSSSSGNPASSGSEVPPENSIMDLPYWLPYWGDSVDERQLDVQIERGEDDNMKISYRRLSMLGAPDAGRSAEFGVAIRVAGEGPDVFSEMKTWTGGACYMLTSDAPIVLKMGMSPEKERELEYDLPQATLIKPEAVGNMVLRCLSWTEFEQQGFGPSITIEDAFFDYMTELRFEVQLDSGVYEGSFEIYQIRPGGSGISANMDGMDITVDDGTREVRRQ